MNFEYNRTEALKNEMGIISLEKLIVSALQFLKTNKTEWLEGIELINDLIYLIDVTQNVVSCSFLTTIPYLQVSDLR
jgi:hypothetical protein